MNYETRTSSFVGNVPPANLFNLLKAAYGTKGAEKIFKSHGLPRPAIALEPSRERATGTKLCA